MKRLALVLLVIVIAVDMIGARCVSKAEDKIVTKLYVTASILNGRSRPSKESFVEARFDRGDILDAVEWSKDKYWIRVEGGEGGYVWVWWEYVTEQMEKTVYVNDYYTRIKIRRKPDAEHGTVLGYLKKGGEVTIDQVLFGWGHCNRGWIDLRYLKEVGLYGQADL